MWLEMFQVRIDACMGFYIGEQKGQYESPGAQTSEQSKDTKTSDLLISFAKGYSWASIKKLGF